MADITRAEVATLIAEEYAPTALQAATQGSAVLSAFPQVNMGTKTVNMPVLATLPTAEFVTESGTGSTKPTSEVVWQNRALVAEEIAVIVPVHENVVDDASVDLLDQIAQQAGQAIGKTFDLAVLFGVNKPASWTSPDFLAAATAAGQLYQVSGSNDEEDLYGSHFLAAGALADAGYEPDTLVAKRSLRYRLANLRNADGSLLLSADGNTYAGLSAFWSRNGGWDPAEAESFVVDASRVRIGVRQDITVKFLDQATVGGINLAERDMVALRVKARMAYVLGDGATSEGADQTPVAAVTPAAAAG